MEGRPKPPRPSARARATPAPETRTTQGERLQKVLAAAGIASRRAAEQLIDEGRVSVDGEVVREQGRRVDPMTARIEVDGERVHLGTDHEYIMLNKPAGVVTTARDPQSRPTVLDLVRTKKRVFPVGRLDVETLGLLLLTDHGDLSHRLTHPKFQVPRVYLAEVRGAVVPAAVERLVKGVRLEDGIARARAARVVRSSRTRTQIELTLTEGKKREVRRMLDEVGYPVVSLVRTRFGPLSLGALASGESRTLTPREVGDLLASVGL